MNILIIEIYMLVTSSLVHGLIMINNFCEPKAAASRESGVRGTVTLSFPGLYSIVKRTVSAFMLALVSISLSFTGDIGSVNAIPAKMDYENLPHSGYEKEFNRAKFMKHKSSKKFDQKKKYNKKLPVDLREERERLRDDMSKECKKVSKQMPRHGFAPHSGFEISSLREQAKLASVFLPDDIWNKLESFTFFAMSMSECVSYSQALSIFMLYLKTHYDDSIVLKASEAFRELFEQEPETIEPHSGLSKPEWLTQLRAGTTNWRMITSNPVFKKISYLISICITLGLCDAASFEWRAGNMKMFSIGALEKHTGAFDLVDAAIETVLYFVEGGYAAFSTGSLAPFMYSDQQALEFDQEFSFLASNIEHVRTGNLRKQVGIDENQFDRRLCSAISLADNLYRAAKGTWEKKIFYDKSIQLKKMKTTFDSIRVQGGLRSSPFTVNFYGKSGVGKSSVSAISMVHGLLANGFDASDEMMVTLNESDKFMSTYRSYINGIFIDDIGNTKADFVEKSPTNKIIEICNNVRQYANMAEADMKGKVSIEPKFVNLTTNVKGLLADTYSNEPVSIARRAHMTVTVTVKPQFCSAGLCGAVGQQLDSAKVDAFYTNADGVVEVPVIPDLWNLTVERVVPSPNPIPGKHDIVAYEPMIFEGKEMTDVSILTYLKCMVSMSREHFARQERLVASSNNMATKIEMCSCGTPRSLCDCNDPHFGVVGYATGVACRTVFDRVKMQITSSIMREGAIIEKMATKDILSLLNHMETNPFFQWTNYVPISWLTHDYGKRFIEYAMRDDIILKVRQETYSFVSLLAFFTMLGLVAHCCFFIFVFPILYRMATVVATVKERMYKEIVLRNDAMPKIFKRVRDNHARYVLATIGVLGALYTLLRVWQGFRNGAVKTEGNIVPATAEDIQQRDAEVNPWAAVPYEAPPTNEVQQTSTASQLANTVHKNQVFLRIKQGDVYRTSGAIFVKSNVLMMPHHMWFVDAKTDTPMCQNLEVMMRRSGGPNDTKVLLSAATTYHIPHTDFCLTFVSNCVSYRDISDYFPLSPLREGLCEMVFRDPQGLRLDARARITPGQVGHRECPFDGASYQLSIPTFSGLCMATFLTHGNPCRIAGFHLGGKTGTPTGVLGYLSRERLNGAICVLSRMEGVCMTHSAGELPKKLYDKDFYLGQKAHAKSPVNFMENEGNYRVYGAITGKATPHSNVVQTIISDTVKEICGVQQQWGPPQFYPKWKPWQESLKYSSNPSIGVEGDYLQWAVKDYQQPLVDLVRKDFINPDVRPLTRMETVCGRDGKRFIDKMPPKTSVGYPLSGPKSDYLTLLDPLDYEDQQFPVELDSMFWEQFDVMREEYLAGRRCYPIFKGCLKDEPTPLSKEKVRVFQAAPIALQLFIRMYYLPIARVLSLYPTLSECAVGINSQGPEWHQLQTFISKYGKDRIFAGDYSKYDLRMPAQVMLSAFRIMINLAEASGNYSEEDLLVMRGIATDICHPVVAYDGTLIQLIGSNPSGQNLTVYINSIVNSLLNRCGFYHIYEERRKDLDTHELTFRQAVALMTYGDDVKGSVHSAFGKFNHISYAKFLADRDMKFTMPDKESTPTEYMRDEDADFLKRKNVFNPDVKMYFGALDEMSIFKSLHATLKSKFLTPEEQACENIDGALREWFAHGRDVYETRREQMKEIALKHNLICKETEISYDDRLTTWKDKYLEPHSGVEQITARLYDRAKNDIPFKCITEDTPVIIQDISEVDLTFQRTHRGCNYVIFVEVKSSNNKSLRHKGRKQLRRLVEGMFVVNPDLNYQGVLLTPRGYDLVITRAQKDFDIFDLPWSE